MISDSESDSESVIDKSFLSSDSESKFSSNSDHRDAFEYHVKIVKKYLENSTHNVNNSKILRMPGECYKVFFDIDWLCASVKQTRNSPIRMFNNFYELKAFLTERPQHFWVNKAGVGLRDKVLEMPDERQVVQAVKQIIQDDHSSETCGLPLKAIFEELPHFCSERLRSVEELRSFCYIHMTMFGVSKDRIFVRESAPKKDFLPGGMPDHFYKLHCEEHTNNNNNDMIMDLEL